MDVPADGQGWTDALDGGEDRLAPDAVVHVALGRRVQDEHGAVGAAGEHVRGAFLVQVEAPVPWRHRHARAKAPEPRAVDLRALAVQHGRGLPPFAGFAERRLRLVVAGYDEGRRVDLAQRFERLLEPAVDRGEV